MASRLLCIAALRPLLLNISLWKQITEAGRSTHTRHPYDTNGQIRSSTKLEQRSRRVQAQCRSHNSCHQEDLAARADRGRRSALETGGHHLRKAGPSFWANKTENKKGAHMPKGGSQLSPLFLFLHTLIDSSHAYGIHLPNLQKTRWTVDSCDLKKVDMTAAPRDAPTEIHCSERRLVDTRTSGSFLSRLCF